MRSISVKLCLAKLFKNAVLNHLKPDVDDMSFFRGTMYGFRLHLSTHGVLLEEKEEVMEDVMHTENANSHWTLEENLKT